jgi:hypothetical protein
VTADSTPITASAATVVAATMLVRRVTT